jgi:AcrR family transcriptional regulator
MAETDKAAEPVDGRTARAVRTRESIVDATISLLAENDLRPSAPRIAERAGVSVRSVFQHFDDLETLYAAVGARVVEQVRPLIRHIDPARPLEDRVREYFHQRAQVNEALTPTLRAAVVHAPGSRTINGQFQSGHDLIGMQVEQVFGPELEQAADRQLLFDALLSIASWSLWNAIRSLNGRPFVEAERVLVHMAACTLGPVVGRDLTGLADLVVDEGSPDATAAAVDGAAAT